ncbi:MAG TPA: hypothetical protein DGT21_08950 [Armatimonadetes bacterium]|nr:hypothetical protein [Armatimonadota bacterium]
MQRPRAGRAAMRSAVRAAQTAGVILLAIVVLAAGVWTFYNVKWNRRLAGEIENWKAIGLPLQVSEAIPPPAGRAENAAPLYLQVFGINLEAASPAAPADGIVLSGVSVADRETLISYLEATDRAPLAPAVADLLRRPEVRATLDVLRKASVLPRASFPVNWELGFAAPMPHLGKLREAARLVTCTALLTAEEGDIAGGLEWCATGVRMAQHVTQEPTLVAQLSGMAMQAMAMDATADITSAVAVPAEISKPLREALAELDILGDYGQAMRLEVALGRATFEQLREHPEQLQSALAGDSDGERLVSGIYSTWLWNPVYAYDMATYMRLSATQYEACRLPWRQGRQTLEKTDKEVAGLTYARLTRVLAPASERVLQRRDTSLARSQLCRVALELKAYKARNGHYPDTPAELQQHLAWDIPEDVFSGESLIYRLSGEGFVLYSTGPDAIDNGGVAGDDGGGGANSQGTDLTWEAVN